MIGGLILIVCGATLLALGYRILVEASRRRGVGVVARQVGNRIYFLDTQILDGALFEPGAQDDLAGNLAAFGDYLVTHELIRRYALSIGSPSAVVKLTGL